MVLGIKSDSSVPSTLATALRLSFIGELGAVPTVIVTAESARSPTMYASELIFRLTSLQQAVVRATVGAASTVAMF